MDFLFHHLELLAVVVLFDSLVAIVRGEVSVNRVEFSSLPSPFIVVMALGTTMPSPRFFQ